MKRIAPRFRLLAVTVLAALAAAGLPAAAQPPEDASGSLTCEVYCSETRLRTAVARLSWISPRMFQGASPTPAGPVAEELQTTVFKNGFAKDLYARFPTLSSGEDPQPAAAAALPEPKMRAYDLEIRRVEPPTAPPGSLMPSADVPAARTTVEIEDLEPGMTYTWRIVTGTAGGQEVAETVTCVAPVCPADFREEDEP